MVQKQPSDTLELFCHLLLCLQWKKKACIFSWQCYTEQSDSRSLLLSFKGTFV